MQYLEDTISAIATAIGESGLGIIRISGPDAITISNTIFRPASGKHITELHPRTAIYGRIYDPVSQEIIDDGMITIFIAPASYTGENTAEISCHGGLVPLRRVLEATLKAGARLAQPGEFTKRAFLNGKMDLTQAEAVLDIIRSKTDTALRIARRQMDGALSSKIHTVRDGLITLLAQIEASIDFPDEVEEPQIDYIRDSINGAISAIKALLSTADRGRIYREGLHVVIIGRPNVGKSSLLNSLLRENRAIVTAIPGTTRDIIEEPINIKGIPVKAIDTAGIRETDDIVERIGVDRTHTSAELADIILLVVDAEASFTNEDMLLMERYSDKHLIVVINKVDKVSGDRLKELQDYIVNQIVSHHLQKEPRVVHTSITEDIGIDKLEDTIAEIALSGDITFSDEEIISNVRHKNALMNALKSLNNALNTASDGLPVDLISIDTRIAIEALGNITGETVTEDVIDRIFSEFCIGK